MTRHAWLATLCGALAAGGYGAAWPWINATQAPVPVVVDLALAGILGAAVGILAHGGLVWRVAPSVVPGEMDT